MKRLNLKIYSDGGARGNPGPAAAAFVVIKDGKVIHESSFYLGETTNNVAEYQGLLKVLEWLNKKFSVKKNADVDIFLDSLLVVNQLNGKYKIKSTKLIPLAKESKKLERNFSGKIIYNFIPREKNKLADRLLNNVLDEKL